jgi:hypothetical protein
MGIRKGQRTFDFFVSTMKPLLNQAFIAPKPLNGCAGGGCATIIGVFVAPAPSPVIKTLLLQEARSSRNASAGL